MLKWRIFRHQVIIGHLHCETRHVTHSFGFGDSKETPTTLAREACEASEACEAEITSWNI